MPMELSYSLYQAVVKDSKLLNYTNATSTGPRVFHKQAPKLKVETHLFHRMKQRTNLRRWKQGKSYFRSRNSTRLQIQTNCNFTPDKQFVGNPTPVTVKRVDKNVYPGDCDLQSRVYESNATGTGDKTEGLQGQVK